MEAAFYTNCVLFFGADRFEPPDWLNSGDLSQELQIPQPTVIRGRTDRRIFARNRLRPTLEWFISVFIDVHLHEYQPAAITLHEADQPQPRTVRGKITTGGPSTVLSAAVTEILRIILTENPADDLQLILSTRHARVLSAQLIRDGGIVRIVRNLLSLSAGESSLFCIFASIIRDVDLALKQANPPIV